MRRLDSGASVFPYSLRMRMSGAFPRLVLGTLAALAVASAAMAGDAVYGYTDDAGTLHLSNVPDDGPYRVILRGGAETRAAPHALGAASRAWTDGPYADDIRLTAQESGLDPALLHSVVAVESNHNPSAVSPKGAIGLMQLMPDTSRRLGVADAKEPRENLRAGARHLRRLLAQFDNDLQLALAAYNAGEEAVVRYGRRIPPFRETREYVRKVVEQYRLQSALAVGKS